MVVGPASPPAPPAGRSVHGGTGVLDGFVHGDDEAGGLRGCRQRVDAHDGRLPHAGLEVIGDVLVVHIHAVPHTSLVGEKREEGLIIGLVRTSGPVHREAKTRKRSGRGRDGTLLYEGRIFEGNTKKRTHKKPVLSANSASEAS